MLVLVAVAAQAAVPGRVVTTPAFVTKALGRIEHIADALTEEAEARIIGAWFEHMEAVGLVPLPQGFSGLTARPDDRGLGDIQEGSDRFLNQDLGDCIRLSR